MPSKTQVTERRSLVATASDAGLRLDRYLAAQLPALSRNQLQHLIRDGAVLLNGHVSRPAERLAPGDRITVTLRPSNDRPVLATAPDLPLAVLHADETIVVVDKQAGQVVHPAAGHLDDTLVNALLARFPDLATTFKGQRPGVVHRLDRDTSGVMVVARTPTAAAHLKRQFKSRTVEKVYLALVKGEVSPPEGLIDAPIGRDPVRRKRMAAIAGGRAAQTAYRILAIQRDYSWVEVRPKTGRTHQIRVHLAAIGHPVAGDRIYGRRDHHIGRAALHANELCLDHPASGERVHYEAPLPHDLAQALAALNIRPD